MPISTNCPKCAALFRLPDELAGRRVKCQRCGQIFQAPAAAAPAAVSPPPPPSAPSPPSRPEKLAPAATEEVIINARLVSENDAPPANAVRAIQAAVPPAVPMDSPRSPERAAERPAPPRRPRDQDRDERHRPPRAQRRARSGTDPWVI